MSTEGNPLYAPEWSEVSKDKGDAIKCFDVLFTINVLMSGQGLKIHDQECLPKDKKRKKEEDDDDQPKAKPKPQPKPKNNEKPEKRKNSESLLSDDSDSHS